MNLFKIKLTLITLLISQIGFSQTADVFNKIEKEFVPLEVIKTFETQNPNQENIEWRKFQDRFEAKYNSENHWVFDRYNKNGNHIETRILLDWETEAPNELKVAKSKVEQKYWEVTEFYKRLTPVGNIAYILQLENENNAVETLYFDESGKLESKSNAGGY